MPTASLMCCKKSIEYCPAPGEKEDVSPTFYEDELVKANGKWLFTKRKIYNEGRDEWAYKSGRNPAW